MINNLRKHLLFIYTVAVIFIVFSRPLNIFASNDSVLSDSVQVGTYTVGDNVTAKVEKEGNIYVLYFKSDEGTLWADWRSKLGHWVKNIDIIKFSTDSSKMILPANSSYLFGSNPNHNEEWALESLDQIDLEKANTSFVTNMTGMFANCENLKVLNLIGFNTVNVKKMASMFDGAELSHL